MRSIINAVIALSLTVGSLFWTQSTHADDLRFFKIASGSVGGTYYPIASSLAKVISNPPGSKSCEAGGNCGIPGLTATAQSSGGSVANVDSLVAKQYPSAIVQSDVTYWAYTGSGPFRTRKPNPDLCVITSLYPEEVHLVATKQSKINSVLDLAGKRVAMGEHNSGALLGAQLMVRAYGLEEGKHFTPTFVNFEGAQQAMKDGKIDAFITVSGHPNKAIASMIASLGAHLVPITGDGAKRLSDGSPFYTLSSIPDGVYPGQSGDIQTIAVTALWISRVDLDQNFLYKLTKAFWTNKAARSILDGGHPKGKSITLRTAFDGVPVPLCTGAQQYYKEAGLLK
jgi:uncharacterized protein